MVVVTSYMSSETSVVCGSESGYVDVDVGGVVSSHEHEHETDFEWLGDAIDDDHHLPPLHRDWDPLFTTDLLNDDDDAPMWSQTLAFDDDAWITRSDSPASQTDSPADSVAMLFSAASSDTDEIFDGELFTPVKRKSSVDDDFNSTAKKIRQMKKAAKPRVMRDDATIKTIAQLRSDSADPESRRRIHNVLERKRRNELKDCYDELREAIPEIATLERAPTGQILQKAVEFIAFLQHEDRELQVALAAARAENERLRRASTQ